MAHPIIHQFELGPLGNFNYIVADPKTGDAVLIDPCDETDFLLEQVFKEKLTLSAVLLTHGHFDHIGGIQELSASLKLPVYLSVREHPMYTPDCKTLKRNQDDEAIMVGKTAIHCLHTPGHSPGCQCFLVEGNLFTGDTLFIDAVGRTDFPGGSASSLFNSLQRIKRLPESTVIWPGHNYGAVASDTLSHLKVHNPCLACTSEEEFLDFFA